MMLLVPTGLLGFKQWKLIMRSGTLVRAEAELSATWGPPSKTSVPDETESMP